MTRWLVVTLAAPLASFGEDAGNVQRGSALRPTRSALIGLAGAALGVERDEANGQRDLAASFLVGTRTIDPGRPVTDFHTYQSLPRSRVPVETRADALARRADLNTSITRRTYRADGLWQAAYLATPDAVFTLEMLVAAFVRPHFALWLGRKSCPLAHPLAPHIVEADDLSEAFAAQAAEVRVTTGISTGTVAVDEHIVAAGLARPGNAARRERRVDEPGDRLRWQFAGRYEHVYAMPAAAAPKEEGVS